MLAGSTGLQRIAEERSKTGDYFVERGSRNAADFAGEANGPIGGLDLIVQHYSGSTTAGREFHLEGVAFGPARHGAQ
jgi:hypothetical protein